MVRVRGNTKCFKSELIDAMIASLLNKNMTGGVPALQSVTHLAHQTIPQVSSCQTTVPSLQTGVNIIGYNSFQPNLSW